MDYQKILKTAEDNLKYKFPEIVSAISERIREGSTGGEIIFKVGKYLHDLKAINREAYDLIEKDILLYFAECKKNGIYIF